MTIWRALLIFDAQEQVVKRAYELSLVLAGTVHHVGRCSCHTVSEIEEWYVESSGFFQANNLQPIADELFAARNSAVVFGDRTLQRCEVSSRTENRKHQIGQMRVQGVKL
jgi:hypothetical protein